MLFFAGFEAFFVVLAACWLYLGGLFSVLGACWTFLALFWALVHCFRLFFALLGDFYTVLCGCLLFLVFFFHPTEDYLLTCRRFKILRRVRRQKVWNGRWIPVWFFASGPLTFCPTHRRRFMEILCIDCSAMIHHVASDVWCLPGGWRDVCCLPGH